MQTVFRLVEKMETALNQLVGLRNYYIFTMASNVSNINVAKLNCSRGTFFANNIMWHGVKTPAAVVLQKLRFW